MKLVLITSVAVAALLAAPAVAQTTPDHTPAPAAKAEKAAKKADEQADIIVTGSRIRRPNLTSPVPVTTVTGDQFFQTGATSIGDVLNELPALRSTFSQSNSTRFLGTSGLNLLDLRGLGTQRTLVLVNGRRHVAGDILNTASSVDTNTIPTDLIERVDVITGGDSAVYGSDAIAGVVNFVLKDHFSGLQIRGQGGISQYGDAANDFTSVLAGVNTKDGRGNIAINLEYAHQADLYASQRTAYAQADGFVQVAPQGTASQPANIFVRDIRNGVYTNAGTFLAYFGGNSYSPLIFQPNGTLAPQTGTQVGLAPTPAYIGGNGDNFRDGTELALQPALDRYSANIVAHYDFSKAAVLFTELSFSRTDTFGSASGPFFTGALGESFNVTNPYLDPSAAALINSQTGGAPFSLYKNVVDLTNRAEQARRDTLRGVIGLKGDLASSLHYEVSANYGQLTENTLVKGNVNLQRYLLAINAVDQGIAAGGAANGKIICAVQADPTQGSPYNNSAYATSTYANDVASCVPVNLFGLGNITNAARNYLLQNSTAYGKITQLDLSGFISGDTSKFFNLPGGPVGFAIGAEYRKETALYTQDAATVSGITFYNSIPNFNPPYFASKEAYAEIRLPLLKDIFAVKSLTVNAATRLADYRGATGSVVSYNAGVEYAPIKSVLFRVNYSHSIRAPNLVDLYQPLGQNYFQFADPCAVRNRGSGTQYRAANCTAAGVPAAYDYVYQSTPGYLSGGNANLQAETSDAWTIGGVFRPEFVPGFSLSVDYYHIKVGNVITSPSAQQIVNACYDLQSLNNQFCKLFKRDTTVGLNAAEYVNNSLQVTPLNYAQLINTGIDFEATYRRQVGKLGLLTVLFNYTHALKKDNYLDPTQPTVATSVVGLLGDPKDAAVADVSLKHNNITLGYKVRYVGKMFNGVYGQDPYLYAPEYAYFPAVFYHNIRADVEIEKKFNIYAGVDNVADKLPPFGLTSTGDGAIYSNVGRFFYVGVKVAY